VKRNERAPGAVPEIPEVVGAREYTAAAVCAVVRISRATLRRYRAAGIVVPTRAAARQVRYSEAAVVRLRTAHRLVRDLGVNLAGAEVALRLLDQLAAVHHELATAHARLDHLQQERGAEAGGNGPTAA
jgi:DNA-binding transcriptional MerR regulator